MNELSIVVPCLASIDIVPDFIDFLSKYLMGNPADVEIIVVANEDAGSFSSVTDYVQKRYPWLKFRMLEKNGQSNGYGSLIRFALAYSTSQYAVMVSPYGEDDISNIDRMLSKIRKGAQVVQASRYSVPEDSEVVSTRFKVYQYLYRKLIRFLLGVSASDFTYGFKMFDRIFIQALGLTQNTRAISPEITIKTILAGGKIEYLPSRISSAEIGGRFKLFKDGFGYLWILIRGFFHRVGIILWF